VSSRSQRRGGLGVAQIFEGTGVERNSSEFPAGEHSLGGRGMGGRGADCQADVLTCTIRKPSGAQGKWKFFKYYQEKGRHPDQAFLWGRNEASNKKAGPDSQPESQKKVEERAGELQRGGVSDSQKFRLNLRQGRYRSVNAAFSHRDEGCWKRRMPKDKEGRGCRRCTKRIGASIGGNESSHVGVLPTTTGLELTERRLHELHQRRGISVGVIVWEERRKSAFESVQFDVALLHLRVLHATGRSVRRRGEKETLRMVCVHSSLRFSSWGGSLNRKEKKKTVSSRRRGENRLRLEGQGNGDICDDGNGE